jgi:hypothetical protein
VENWVACAPDTITAVLLAAPVVAAEFTTKTGGILGRNVE